MREKGRSPAAAWIATVAVVILAVVVGLLALLAYERMNPDVEPGVPAPVPTFESRQTTPTPEPESEPAAVAPGAAERFLAVASGAWWRATAGACDAAEPVVERSPDGGGTWTDVTPRYRGVAQVGAVGVFTAVDGEFVGAEGADCGTHLLRTYTAGTFWDSYPEVLAGARYLALDDPATVVTPAGPLPAPCAEAWGLRASGDTLALVCGPQAWTTAGDEWLALPGDGAVAVAVDGSDVLVALPGASGAAVTGTTCDGVAIVRFAGGDAGAPTFAACAEEADASAPAALAVGAPGLVLWSGDQLLVL